MTTDKAAPDCSGCKWYDSGVCATRKVAQVASVRARARAGDCGPSGRYFEPREDAPEE
jgi:hypothetical protein